MKEKVIVEKEPSPANKREKAIRDLEGDELLQFTLRQSRLLQEAKSLLRIAAKQFRWMQKPTEAQDIDKFLDSVK